MKRPRASTESTRTWLGRLELAQWLDAAEKIGGDTYVLACLLAINALRVGEACGANVTDVAADRHHRTLRIVGKGDKPAVVPLTARTVHALVAYSASVAPEPRSKRGKPAVSPADLPDRLEPLGALRAKALLQQAFGDLDQASDVLERVAEALRLVDAASADPCDAPAKSGGKKAK